MWREREGDDLLICPVSRIMVSERSIGYFETRVDWLTRKSDNSR